MTGRIGYIDALKGLAMIMVVCGHLLIFCGLGNENKFIYHIVLVNMPLFFCLNGLVASSVNSARKIIIKMSQLLLPFVTWGALLCLFKGETYTDYLNTLFHFGYWYLIVLAEFYATLALFDFIRGLSPLKYVWTDCLLVLIMWGGIRQLARIMPEQMVVSADFWFYSDYFLYFFIGVLIKKHNLLKWMELQRRSLFTLTSVFLVVFYVMWVRDILPQNLAMFLVIDFIVWIILLFQSIYEKDDDGKFINRSKGILREIGQNTLVIYMTQFFLFRYIDLTDVYDYLYGTGNALFIIALTVVLAVLLSYFCIGVGYVLNQSKTLSFAFLGKYSRKNQHTFPYSKI